MAVFAKSTLPSEGTLAFLQHRVAMFGLVAGVLGAGFFLVRLGVIAALGPEAAEAEWTHPSLWWHLAASAVLLGVWLVNRSGRRGRRFILVSDVGGLALSSLFYQLMGASIPLVARPELVLLLALTMGVMARAIYVPTSPRYTILVCALIGVPMVTLMYFMYAGAADTSFMRATPDVPIAELTAFFGGVWWACTTALAAASSSIIHGLRGEVSRARRLGQYTLERKLGEGGMGAVYVASHAMLRRPTAVKLLLPDRAGDENVARFEREVQLTARLSHPNTITIFDYGRTPEGIFYYAMELLEGGPLDVVIDISGPMPPERVLHIMDQVAGALGEAHGIGLIHRDIKPANIVLSNHGGLADFAKVLDFGLVKDLSRDASTSLTHADVITGTPMYMAPEAIRAPGEVDGRADLYGLGAVGYFLLTGQHVFVGSTVVEVCTHHLHTRPEPPSDRLGAPVPPDVERLILRCLEKDPDRRPASAEELQRELRACESWGAWTPSRAVAWWRAHGADVQASRAPAGAGGTGHTIEIDLGRRAA